MANTVFGVNDAQTNKLWSKRLQTDAIKKTWIGKFIGSTDEAIVYEHKELKKTKGDNVKYDLRLQISGRGVQGDNTLKGKEEKQRFYQDNITIDQLRHAVDRGGNMSLQRVLHDMRKGCNILLSDWWAARFDRSFFCHAAGYTATDEVTEFGETYQGSDTAYTGNVATVAPTSGRHFWSETGADSDDDLDATGDGMALSLIDDLVTEAKLASPTMRPVKFEGEDLYVFVMHPYQTKALRRDTSTGGWLDIQKAALMGGKTKDNPIFSGALGMYNNVVLHESTRIPRGVNPSTGVSISTVRRAVMLGAQSAVLAFGGGSDFEAWNWKEEESDYGNQLGVAAGSIFGMKKCQFNSADFGTMVLSTYAA